MPLPNTTVYALLATQGSVIHQKSAPLAPHVIHNIQHRLGEITKLILRDVPCSPGASKALHILQSRTLPCLVKLEIDVVIHSTATVPITFVMQREQLPCLRSLILRNVRAEISNPVLTKLEKLVVVTDDLSPNPFAVHQLFADPENLASMTTLEIFNCIGCAPHPPCGSVPRPLIAHELQWFTLEDTPSAISHILSSLVIPYESNVTLIVNLRGSGHYARPSSATILAIKPTDVRNLPILGSVAKVKVICTKDDCHIHAVTATEGSLKVRLLPDVHVQDPFAQYELFEQMVLAMRQLFAGSSITDMHFQGPLSAIRGATWETLFDQSPQLQRLKIGDLTLEGSPLPLLSALTRFCPRMRSIVCPDFVALSLQCAMVGMDVPVEVDRCFGWRYEWMPHIIEGLHIHVGADPATAQAFLMRTEEYWEMLHPYAAEVTLRATCKSLEQRL
ncbi:hypothetical protein BC628DRAFT_923702 [Trametes gibbosa]|nr:hypothetical protein BC628DRAFT_923702 [Trametes gibbosa]